MSKTALNRTSVQLLTNKSGGGVAQGDVVVIDTGTASSFTTTAVEGYVAQQIGVVVEPNGIANNATGLIATGGYVSMVNLDGAAALGDFIKTDGVIKQGTPHATPSVAGDFAQALTAGATPEAILFGSPNWATGGGGGGGDSTYTDVYGSRPAASNDGDLFLPSDGFVIERDTGADWIPWGPLFPFTAPVNGDFAWINQGGASVSTTKGGIHLAGPAGGAASHRIRKKAAPSTPYTITIAFLPNFPGLDYFSAGLVFHQSSDGKFITHQIQYNAGWILSSQKWTNPTTFSANYFTGLRPPSSSAVFLRIEDDGANRQLYWSVDLQNWIQLHTVGRTDFITADEVGFFLNVQNATYDGGMTLLSWVEG